MATAREAYEHGGEGALGSAFVAEVARYARSVTEELRVFAEAAGVVHGVPRQLLTPFHAAIAYGLWEDWAPIDPPLPCPQSLIEGYREADAESVAEFRRIGAREEALPAVEVVAPSRVFERRLKRLAPPGDPSQPARVQWAIRDLANELGEMPARYGIATGIGIRFLRSVRESGVARERWFRPITVSAALEDWAVEPFWVDVVKVGKLDDPEFAELLGKSTNAWYALRDGTERDHQITFFVCEKAVAAVGGVARKRKKRLSSDSVETLEAPPHAHLWAFSQLGISELVVGDYQVDLRYMISSDELAAIRSELIGARQGKVVIPKLPSD